MWPVHKPFWPHNLFVMEMLIEMFNEQRAEGLQ
jgi:hypothetical protein